MYLFPISANYMLHAELQTKTVVLGRIRKNYIMIVQILAVAV
jgi:hypothetical protein